MPCRERKRGSGAATLEVFALAARCARQREPRAVHRRPCAGLAALGAGGRAAGCLQVVLMAAHDVGDHAADLRVPAAAGLLERGDLVLEPRLELAGDLAL